MLDQDKNLPDKLEFSQFPVGRIMYGYYREKFYVNNFWELEG